MSVVKKSGINNALHPVRPFCQDVNYKLLLLRFPSSHITIRAYNPLHIFLDVLFLSPLVV
jgi:hypothetical protein